jgi:hypothetical protein
MKTPTLQEVKLYFKNAKEVKSLWDFVFEMKIETIHYERDSQAYYAYDNKKELRCIWSKKYAKIISYKDEPIGKTEQLQTPNHYDNSKGSLYQFCENQNLNSYEFEIIKRVVRCRKKGEFISDIEKTIKVLQIYLQEQGEKYSGQIEKLNK